MMKYWYKKRRSINQSQNHLGKEQRKTKDAISLKNLIGNLKVVMYRMNSLVAEISTARMLITKQHVTTICWISYAKWSRQQVIHYQRLLRVTHTVNVSQGGMKTSRRIEKMLCSGTQFGYQQENH